MHQLYKQEGCDVYGTPVKDKAVYTVYDRCIQVSIAITLSKLLRSSWEERPDNEDCEFWQTDRFSDLRQVYFSFLFHHVVYPKLTTERKPHCAHLQSDLLAMTTAGNMPSAVESGPFQLFRNEILKCLKWRQTRKGKVSMTIASVCMAVGHQEPLSKNTARKFRPRSFAQNSGLSSGSHILTLERTVARILKLGSSEQARRVEDAGKLT